MTAERDALAVENKRLREALSLIRDDWLEYGIVHDADIDAALQEQGDRG